MEKRLYALTAAIIWMLVVYSLSPLSRAEPVHLASRLIPFCDRTVSR